MQTSTFKQPAWNAFAGADQRWRQLDGIRQAELLGDPVFSAAHRIWRRASWPCAELEARILADQPRLEIALAMCEKVQVIDAFETWFFDVRSRRQHSSWIIHEAIRRHPSGELAPHDVAAFWRWVGFEGGLGVLEPLLTLVDRSVLAGMGLAAYWQPQCPLDIEFKLMIAAECVPAPRSAKELGRLARIEADPLWHSTPPSADFATPLAMLDAAEFPYLRRTILSRSAAGPAMRPDCLPQMIKHAA